MGRIGEASVASSAANKVVLIKVNRARARPTSRLREIISWWVENRRNQWRDHKYWTSEEGRRRIEDRYRLDVMTHDYPEAAFEIRLALHLARGPEWFSEVPDQWRRRPVYRD